MLTATKHLLEPIIANMPSYDAQPTEPQQFNIKNVSFDPITKRTFNGDKGEMSFFQSNIKIRYPNGHEGPLMLVLPRCTTFGISTKYSDLIDKVSFSIKISNRDMYTEEHKRIVQIINEVVQAAKNFTLTDESKAKLGQYDLEERDLKDISPLKYQKDPETKRIRLDLPPVINPKLMCVFKKDLGKKVCETVLCNEAILDENGWPTQVDPFSFVSKNGLCTPVIKIESIYYGAKYKIQLKLYQADVSVADNGFKNFLVRQQEDRNKRFKSNDDTSMHPVASIEPEEEPELMDSDAEEPVQEAVKPDVSMEDDEEEEADEVASQASSAPSQISSPPVKAEPIKEEPKPATKAVRRGGKK